MRQCATQMQRRLVVLGFAATITVAVGAQQPTGPTFRGQVDIVSVDVFVTDGAGNPVPNLRLEDFELLEDGRPQVITSFTEVNIPINPPAPFLPDAPRSDVATNEGSAGRIYVIALDEIAPDLALRARRYLRTFIEQHFEPNDVGVVVNLGRARSKEAQDFTSDRSLLLAAIDKLKGWAPDGAVPAPLGESPIPRPPSFRPRDQASALKALIRSLARLPAGRKAMLYVGQDMGDVYRVIDNKGGVLPLELEDLRTAMTEAMRGGVAIYAIHACGLSPGGSLGESEAPESATCGVSLDQSDTFRRLASATGGFAVVNSNGFDQALTRVVRENSSYYLLGFSSTNNKRDGRYRRLEVRARKPGLTVRTRDGYIAPSRPDRPDERRRSTAITAGEAINSPINNTGLPMKVFAAAFKSAKGNRADVLITAEVDGSKLGLTTNDESANGQLELAAAAINASGKVTYGPPRVFNLTIDSETYKRAAEQGIRVVSTLTLPPDRYQLRVGAGNPKSDSRLGSVIYDLEVPDFDKGPLTLSTVVLMTAADRAVTASPKALTGVLPMAPTPKREFPSGTRVLLYAEAYLNAGGREPRSVELKVELRDQKRSLFGINERRTRNDRGTEAFSMAVPLDVPAGSFRLHVEATSGTTVVSRDIPLRVR